MASLKTKFNVGLFLTQKRYRQKADCKAKAPAAPAQAMSAAVASIYKNVVQDIYSRLD